jgi:outer membrane protein
MKKSLVTAAVLLAIGTPAVAADLMEVFARAQRSDPQIAAAAAAHGAALEAKPQAWSALSPKIAGSAAQSHNEYDIKEPASATRSGDTTTYGINLVMPVYHQDYFTQIGQANSRVAQADAEFASAEQNLIVRTASTYFVRLGAEDNLRFAQAFKKSIEQQLKEAQQRFDVGLVAITDVREAQARYDSAVALEITARNQMDTATEQLRELTGEEYPQLNVLGDVPLTNPEPANIDEWVNNALGNNLGLRAAQAQADQADKEITRRRAGHLPYVDLTAGINHYDLPSGSSSMTKYDNTSVGVQLTVPLFQGGYVTSRTREAEQLYNQAKAGLDAQRRATVRLTRDAYLGVQAGMSQVEALRQAVTSAETALEATTVGYEVGTRTAVDVLNSQQLLYGAQRDYANARYNYVLSLLRLKQAVGSLTEEDLARVNNWLTPPAAAAGTEAAPAPNAPATPAAPDAPATPANP